MKVQNVWRNDVFGASGAIAPGASSEEPEEIGQALVDKGLCVTGDAIEPEPKPEPEPEPEPEPKEEPTAPEL